MPFTKIDRIIAAVAMLAFCCSPPLRAEIIVLDDKTVMQGRIGELEDEIVKFYSEHYDAIQLRRISDARVDDNVSGTERVAQQANVDRLLYVINRTQFTVRRIRQESFNLLITEKFDELDKLAKQYLEKRSRYPRGGWMMLDFYSGLQRDLRGRGESSYRERKELIRRWMAARPESQTARIALMAVYIDHAWARRGTGFIGSVTREGRNDFKENLAKSVRIGNRLRTEPVGDPALYLYLIRAYMGLGADDALVLSLLREAEEVMPGFHPVYIAAITTVLPKWGGSQAQVRYFLDEIAPGTLGTTQPEYYYRLALALMNEIEDVDFPSYELDWKSIQAGYAAYREHYLANELEAHGMAKLAALHDDRESALAYLGHTTGQWNPYAQSVWGYKPAYNNFRQWAESPPSSAFEKAARAIAVRVAVGNPTVTSMLAPEVFRESDLFGKTLLHYIADNNIVPLVADFAPYSDVNARDSSGSTPLHLAVRHNFSDTAKILLENGADADARLIYGRRNAIHDAASKGYTQTLQVLLAARPDLINSRSGRGDSPLGLAVAGNYENTVAFLLQQPEIDVNTRGYSGYNSLHRAVWNGHDRIVSLLIKAGADVNLTDRSYRAPLDVAEDLGHDKIANLLAEAGATNSPRKLTDEDNETLAELIKEANTKTNDKVYQEAIQIYQQIVQQWDQNWDAHYHLSRLLWTYAKKPAEAAIHMDRAIELNPGYAEAYYWAGRIYHVLEMPEKYRPYFQHYVEIEPDSYNSQDLIKRYSHLLRDENKEQGQPVQQTVSEQARLEFDSSLVPALGTVLLLCLLLLGLRIRSAKKEAGTH